jgi:hypothetical protein
VAEAFLAQRHLQVDNTGFTTQVNPIGCNKITVRNGNAPGGIALRVSTLTSNAEAYDLIQAGDAKDYILVDISGDGRLAAGVGTLSFKADTAGTVDVFLTFAV